MQGYDLAAWVGLFSRESHALLLALATSRAVKSRYDTYVRMSNSYNPWARMTWVTTLTSGLKGSPQNRVFIFQDLRTSKFEILLVLTISTDRQI